MVMKCRIEAKVIPGSSRTEITGWLGKSLKIKVSAPPEKGKANQAVIKLLSELLALSEDSITIVSGASSQKKLIEIKGISEQQLEHALPSKPA